MRNLRVKKEKITFESENYKEMTELMEVEVLGNQELPYLRNLLKKQLQE